MIKMDKPKLFERNYMLKGLPARVWFLPGEDVASGNVCVYIPGRFFVYGGLDLFARTESHLDKPKVFVGGLRVRKENKGGLPISDKDLLVCLNELGVAEHISEFYNKN